MLGFSKQKCDFQVLWVSHYLKSNPLNNESLCVSNRWRFNCLCQFIWAHGGLLSKVKLISFLRKLPMYLLVNSSDFICKLSVMCSIPFICCINLMYLINLQEKTLKESCCSLLSFNHLFVQNHCILLNVPSKWNR
jgi:hypothetical protein